MAFEAELASVTYLILLACAVLAWPRFLRPSGPWRWFFTGGLGFIAFVSWPGTGWDGIAAAQGAVAAAIAALTGAWMLLAMLRKAGG